MNLIDTHCHLYLNEFRNDIAAVMERALSLGVQRFYLPSIDSTETDAMLSLEAAWPGKFFLMMGLHPCSVKDNYLEELKHVEDWLARRRFAAVGEIGLDFYWDTTYSDQQYRAFELQMEWALQYRLPIVIHSRNAMRETINAVRPFAAKGLKGIFHCFGGTEQEALEIIELGFLLGIGGVVTYKKAGLDQSLRQVSLDHMVLETDAPYLTPAPFRGKRNESSYLPYVVERLAEIKQCSPEEVAAITTRNAERLFADGPGNSMQPA